MKRLTQVFQVGCAYGNSVGATFLCKHVDAGRVSFICLSAGPGLYIGEVVGGEKHAALTLDDVHPVTDEHGVPEPQRMTAKVEILASQATPELLDDFYLLTDADEIEELLYWARKRGD